jgi:DNA-binding PadR family transcriptional regulator
MSPSNIELQQVRTDVDRLSWILLKTLGEADTESLNTSQLKRRTGIETNEKIRYRVKKKLEPNGLVESRQPDSDGARIPAKEVSITDKGRELQQEYGPDDLDTREDRIDDVERRINRIENRQEEVLSRLEIIETKLDMSDDTDLPSIDQMRRGFRAMYDYLEEEDDANLFAYMPDEEIR